ncbi:retrovirus-related pol polyprotein from transposon TNT 1-94 [Tanacetum coccineum]
MPAAKVVASRVVAYFRVFALPPYYARHVFAKDYLVVRKKSEKRILGEYVMSVKTDIGPDVYGAGGATPRAIYRTEVCTEVRAGAIYPNKVVSEPGYDKQWQKTWTDRADGMKEGRKQNRNKSKSWKIGEIKDKEVNMAAGDYDDALVCCVENTIDDRIMDSGASFHATYCKEELERFKLRSGKVRLADDKTLDIAGVGDVVLKTSFGTSWTLKDVRYIPGLKRRRLISAGQLEEEGYHVGFGDQQWKRRQGNCRGWSKFIQKAMALHLLHQSKDLATMILLSKTAAGVAFCVENGIVMLKMVPETPLQFGVAERLSRTFRAESTGIRAEAPKMLWADSVSTTYLIYGIPYVPIRLRYSRGRRRGKDTSRTLEVAQMKCDTAFRIRRVTRLSEVEILHLRTQFIEPENDSIVAEHGLSSEFTQSPGGRLRGLLENGEPESYSEALSSKESVQWKKAIIEEMVSLEKNQTWSLVRISAGKKASQRLWMFRVKEEQDDSKRGEASDMAEFNSLSRQLSCPCVEMKDRCSEKQVLGYVLTVGVKIVEWESRLQKSITIYTKSSIHLAKNLKNEEPCRDVHQVGDEREVEALSSLNLPPRLLMNGGWCLTRERKVRAVALLKGRWFEVYRDYLRRRAVKLSASKWEIVDL